MKTLLLISALLASSLAVQANSTVFDGNEVEQQSYQTIKTVDFFQIKKGKNYILTGDRNHFRCEEWMSAYECDLCVKGSSECPYWDPM